MCDKIRSIKDDCSAVSCAPATCSHDTTDVMSFGAVALLSLSLQCPPVIHGPPSARLARRAASAKVPGTYFTEAEFDT